jgi:hypothetical protein
MFRAVNARCVAFVTHTYVPQRLNEEYNYKFTQLLGLDAHL